MPPQVFIRAWPDGSPVQPNQAGNPDCEVTESDEVLEG